MPGTSIVNDELSLDEKYRLLGSQIRSLLNKGENILSNLANFTAALKQTFDKISWVGFYLYDGKKLFVGPYQGKVACTIIEIGKGVCGKAAELKQTVIVEDVDTFPGHIACDPDSKSEIVIPIMKEDKLFGVLDLDSNNLSAFSETDKKHLEEYCNFLSSEIV
jgi:L-methionine (R)-S-oxide reductase